MCLEIVVKAKGNLRGPWISCAAPTRCRGGAESIPAVPKPPLSPPKRRWKREDDGPDAQRCGWARSKRRRCRRPTPAGRAAISSAHPPTPRTLRPSPRCRRARPGQMRPRKQTTGESFQSTPLTDDAAIPSSQVAAPPGRKSGSSWEVRPRRGLLRSRAAPPPLRRRPAGLKRDALAPRRRSPLPATAARSKRGPGRLPAPSSTATPSARTDRRRSAHSLATNRARGPCTPAVRGTPTFGVGG